MLTFGLNGFPGDPKSQIQIQNQSGGFDDFARLQTARADSNPLRASAYQSANGLQVWIKAAVGAIVCVAYGVTKLRSFATDLTAFRHCYVPPMRILL
jgi:hypothetical protein